MCNLIMNNNPKMCNLIMKNNLKMCNSRFFLPLLDTEKRIERLKINLNNCDYLNGFSYLS